MTKLKNKVFITYIHLIAQNFFTRGVVVFDEPRGDPFGVIRFVGERVRLGELGASISRLGTVDNFDEATTRRGVFLSGFLGRRVTTLGGSRTVCHPLFISFSTRGDL
jgi:hypothetical protein